jgi:hypothetical protein
MDCALGQQIRRIDNEAQPRDARADLVRSFNEMSWRGATRTPPLAGDAPGRTLYGRMVVPQAGIPLTCYRVRNPTREGQEGNNAKGIASDSSVTRRAATYLVPSA